MDKDMFIKKLALQIGGTGDIIIDGEARVKP